MLTQLCNCIQSSSEYVRQACHCDFAAALAFDSTSEAAIIGRACLNAIECGGDPIVTFHDLVACLAPQLRLNGRVREIAISAIAEVGQRLGLSPSAQSQILDARGTAISGCAS